MQIAPPTDPIAAVTHPDPYPYYVQLAAAPGPTRHDGLGLWIVARPEHVAALLAHPDAHVVLPPGLPGGYDQFARFTNGPKHAELRAETIARIDALHIDDPALSVDDLDAFVESYSLYAMARDIRSHVKGDLLFQSYDATRGLIGNALAMMARDSSVAVDDVVDRTVRLDPPVHNTRRVLVADISLGEAMMRKGDTALVILVGSTFGQGAHRCPGDIVAERIADSAVRRVVASGVALRCPVGYVPRPNVRIPLFNAPA